jgi:Na+/H+ antiporter NhaC
VGKADIDQPFLADLNLCVDSHARQLSEAAGIRIDRLIPWSNCTLVPIAITAAQSAGDPCWNAAMPALAFLALVVLALVALLFVADATLTEPPICLTKYE